MTVSLVQAYLLAEHINHGINLTRSPVLQYLFILAKVRGQGINGLLSMFALHCFDVHCYW